MKQKRKWENVDEALSLDFGELDQRFDPTLSVLRQNWRTLLPTYIPTYMHLSIV